MNFILASLAVLAADPTGIFEESSQPQVEVMQQETILPLGKEAIEKIRKDYTDKKYDFTVLDEAYKQVNQNEGLKNLAEMRMGPIPSQQAWEALMKTVIQERNVALLQAVGANTSLFAQKVHAIATPIDPTVEEALMLLSNLHALKPGTGNNSDENALIALDLEYEYKMLHLEMPSLSGQNVTDIREKQIALKMEQLDQMLEASKNFQDLKLQKAVETLHKNLDQLMALNLDLADIRQMLNQSQTQMGEKVSQILNDYQEKFSQLANEFLEQQAIAQNEQN